MAFTFLEYYKKINKGRRNVWQISYTAHIYICKYVLTTGLKYWQAFVMILWSSVCLTGKSSHCSTWVWLELLTWSWTVLNHMTSSWFWSWPGSSVGVSSWRGWWLPAGNSFEAVNWEGWYIWTPHFPWAFRSSTCFYWIFLTATVFEF